MNTTAMRRVEPFFPPGNGLVALVLGRIINISEFMPGNLSQRIDSVKTDGRVRAGQGLDQNRNGGLIMMAGGGFDGGNLQSGIVTGQIGLPQRQKPTTCQQQQRHNQNRVFPNHHRNVRSKPAFLRLHHTRIQTAGEHQRGGGRRHGAENSREVSSRANRAAARLEQV